MFLKPKFHLLIRILLLWSSLQASGTVYLVLGSDTAIWEGMNVGQFSNYYSPDLYLNPMRNAARVMDPAFRNQLVDSYGTPMKLTWWMMGGNIFRYATNTNVPVPNTMTLYLMQNYYGDALSQFGDELSLHYHTFIWSDLNGDGRFWWNQAPSFTDSQDDWTVTLGQYLLEENVFPVSFRSGWHYMDNAWQAELNRWIPYSMHNDWPQVHTDTEEPIDNNYDWSRSPAAFVPFQPSPDDYQLPGGNRGWNLRSVHFNRVRYLDLMDSLFIKANQGEDQVACFWGHLPESDFLNNLIILDSLAHQVQAEYPDVTFRYCTATEAMQRWLGSVDTLPPTLELSAQDAGSFTELTVTVDEHLFQPQPFITWKERYEVTRVIGDAVEIAENTWQVTIPQEMGMLGKIAVAVTDTIGNLATQFLRLLPDDIYVDNRDPGYSEILGDWTTTENAAWGRDSRLGTLNPGDTARIQWDVPNLPEGLVNLFTQFPVPMSGITVRGIVDNGLEVDTVALQGGAARQWVWIQSVTIQNNLGLTVQLVFSGDSTETLTIGADVLKVSAYVRDRDITVQPALLDLEEISILDTQYVSLTIGNAGIEPLMVTDIRLYSTDTSVLEDSAVTIPEMSRREIIIPLVFSDFGPIQDTLLLLSNDPQKPIVKIPITGSVENYFVIVDNEDGDTHYQEFGDWHTSNAQAYGPSSRYCFLNHGSPGGRAIFSTTLPLSGIYDLYEIVPTTVNASNTARYRIDLNGILLDSVVIDQNSGSGNWVYLGRYFLPAQVPVSVDVLDPGTSTVGSVLRADAIKIQLVEEMDTAPELVQPPVPARLELEPVFPNPFNARVSIPFRITGDTELDISIYDIRGRNVRSLYHGPLKAGKHQLSWDGTTDSYEPAATGLYFIVFNAGEFRTQQKVLYLK